MKEAAAEARGQIIIQFVEFTRVFTRVLRGHVRRLTPINNSAAAPAPALCIFRYLEKTI